LLRIRPAARFAWLPAALLVVPFGLVACGGDDDGGGGPGGDEAYVRDVCGAMASFEGDFEELLTSSPTSLDEIEELATEMGELFGDLANDLDDANPPSDAEEAHNSLVSYLQDASEALETGDLEALEEFEEEPDLTMDADVEERLAAIAADVDECEGLDLFEN
jgi:hypothetical protein